MKNIIFLVSLVILIALAVIYTLSSRYEIQVLGKSRDACLRLDKWTGKVQLCPIDFSLVYPSDIVKKLDKIEKLRQNDMRSRLEQEHKQLQNSARQTQ